MINGNIDTGKINHIWVTVAMHEEARVVVDKLVERGYRFSYEDLKSRNGERGIYMSDFITVVVTGVTPLYSVTTLTNLVSGLYKNLFLIKPDLVVNIGTAGFSCVDNSMSVGDAVVLNSFQPLSLFIGTDSYNDPYRFKVDGLDVAGKSRDLVDFSNVSGYTSDFFVDSTKANLFNSDLVSTNAVYDMESFAQAQLFRDSEIPFISIKGLSDNIMVEGNYETFEARIESATYSAVSYFVDVVLQSILIQSNN